MKRLFLLIIVIVGIFNTADIQADNYIYDEKYDYKEGCWLFDGYKCLYFDKTTQTFSFNNSMIFAMEAGLECRCSFLRGDINIPDKAEYMGISYPVVEISTFYQNLGTVFDVSIPESIKTLSTDSFHDVAVDNIYFSEGLETIGNDCFNLCYKSTIDPDSKGLQALLLPESVKEIGEGCISSCNVLLKVRIPSGITTLKRGCLTFLPLLPEINLPDRLEIIEKNCFVYCESLSSITFPESLTSIGENCFYECKSLKSVVLPSHPVQMTNVFNYCPAIETVVCPSEAYDIDEDSFNEVNFRKCILFVPKEYVEDFKQAKGWSRFKIIRGFDSGVDNVLSSGNAVRIEGRYVFADTDIEIYDNNGIRVLSIAKDGSAQLDKGSYIWKSETDAGKFMVK